MDNTNAKPPSLFMPCKRKEIYNFVPVLYSYGENVDGNVRLVMKFRKNSKDKYGTTFYQLLRNSVVVSNERLSAYHTRINTLIGSLRLFDIRFDKRLSMSHNFMIEILLPHHIYREMIERVT